jgi:hypothetical protein
MTNEEMFAALERGHDRFTNRKSGKVYRVDPSQRDVLEYKDACVIAYPEFKHPRKRGRAWSFISPKNLEIA